MKSKPKTKRKPSFEKPRLEIYDDEGDEGINSVYLRLTNKSSVSTQSIPCGQVIVVIDCDAQGDPVGIQIIR